MVRVNAMSNDVRRKNDNKSYAKKTSERGVKSVKLRSTLSARGLTAPFGGCSAT
jgi:hypothetical protein